jgi:hypothetical protein
VLVQPVCETKFTQTTEVVYISVCTSVLKVTWPILLTINHENAVFATGASMLEEENEYMMKKC